MQFPFVSRASYNAEVDAHTATAKALAEANDLIAKQAADLITVREACANRIVEANAATERHKVEANGLRQQLAPFITRRKGAGGRFVSTKGSAAA